METGCNWEDRSSATIDRTGQAIYEPRETIVKSIPKTVTHASESMVVMGQQHQQTNLMIPSTSSIPEQYLWHLMGNNQF